MEDPIKTLVDNLFSSDKDIQNQAYSNIIDITNKPVDWAYEIWDDMVQSLTHKDNHVRAIASQVLCNLAKSDPEKRMLKDFDALLNVTRDDRFVTARHCLQNIWKVGAAGSEQQVILIDGLKLRFEECTAEKNTTLIRFDIIVGLKNLYDVVADEAIKELALSLIDAETDEKYHKKYAKVWRVKK
jgi:hypothetical protein